MSTEFECLQMSYSEMIMRGVNPVVDTKVKAWKVKSMIVIVPGRPHTERFLAAEKRHADAAVLPDLPDDASRDCSQLTANGDQWGFRLGVATYELLHPESYN